MGKRSSFPRRLHDAYSTPPAAVQSLLPHLPKGETFCEPCVGKGALKASLERGGGLRCAAASDIVSGLGFPVRDARTLEPEHLCGAALIITNPPWDRPVLHALIERLSDLAPTWLLLDAAWVHTKQSAPFQRRLARIVSIGRLRWIEGTKMTGKDDAAWHLFDARHTGPCLFFGRMPSPKT